MVLCNEGKTIQNKTFEYLTPLFRFYNPIFIDKLNNINVLAYGIADSNDVTNNEPSFYILINTNVRKAQVIYFLDFIISHECFIKHYNFDKTKIMVVITIPQKYHSTYYHFRRGHYSKMYSVEEIKQFFDNEKRKVTYHKLMKTDTGLELYSNRIANDFDITLSEDKINDYKTHTEYDIPISVNITNEIFNKRKKQE